MLRRIMTSWLQQLKDFVQRREYEYRAECVEESAKRIRVSRVSQKAEAA